MTSLSSLRNQAILVGLLVSLTLACGKTSPAPNSPNTARNGGAGGAGGNKATGGQSGSPGGAGGIDNPTGTGGVAAAGGIPGTGTGTGGAGGAGGAATDTAVDPAEDAKVDVAVEDVLPPPDVPGCTDTCNIGRKRCSNDRVQECVMMGMCPKWLDGPACAAPMLCSQTGNTAACACPSSCTAGRKRCQNGMIEECGTTDGCPAWKNPTACAQPMTCVASNNSASCSCPAGPCDNGDKRCFSGALQECKPATAGACPSWQPSKTCAANQECTDPAGGQPADCRCKPVCTQGNKKCVDGHLEECVTIDGCLAWKATNCGAGETCTMMGANNASCGCPGTSCKIGDKQCLGTGIVQVCQGPAGGCGTFQNEGTCSNGRICTKGPDVGGKKTASCDCPDGSCTAGEQRCDGTGVHQICDATGGKCGVFVNNPCPFPKQCEKDRQGSAGACACPTGNCTIGQKKCGSSAILDTCTDIGQGCGKFTQTACGDGKTCTGDACVTACATPNLCTVGASKCDGEKLVKCEGPATCPAFGANTCAADQKCQNKPGTNPAVPVCCPKTCVEPNECGVGTNPTTIRKCATDANGCIVPTLVACENNFVCRKVSGTAACRAPQ